MKTMKLTLAAATAALVLNLASTDVQAQERRERPPGGERGGDRGGFDPEQMRARMMERIRESLEVKSDDEWKVIEPRITKVSDARRAMGGFGTFGRGSFGGRRGGEDRGGGGRTGGMFGEPNPEAEALEKAIEAKASSDEIKAKLAKYRESQKTRQATLTAAQEELRKVLSVRQEATMVTMGLLQ